MTVQRFRVTMTAGSINACPDDRAGSFLGGALAVMIDDIDVDLAADESAVTYYGTVSTVAGHAALRAVTAIAFQDWPVATQALDELEQLVRGGAFPALRRLIAEREGER